jgi:alpha-mannosidase
MSNEAFVVTSFRYKNDKKVEIRLFNCSDEQQKGELEVNLHDSVKKILLDAEPWSILTLDIN